MTCALDPGNPIDALYEVLKRYPGGVEAVAARRRMSPSVLYKKLEHNNDTHHLRFDEFSDFVAWSAGARVDDPYQPLRALNWRHDHVAVHVPLIGVGAVGDVTMAMVKVASEVGDVATELQRRIADGDLSPDDFRRIDTEIQQAVAALTILRGRARKAAFGEEGGDGGA